MKLYIDPDSIAEQVGKFQEAVKQDVKTEVERLATVTKAQIDSWASEELHSARKIFAENCKFKEVAEGVWVIEIQQKALWIEEGIPQGFDMKPGLLKDAKTSPATGNKYKVIPFDHGKPKTQVTPFAGNVIDNIRNQLRKDKINFKKIEVNKDGSPRVGKLHTLNYGGDVPGNGNTPIMNGISIYQSAKGGKVRRDILTFRTVSSKQDGKWKHPGYDGKKYLDRAYDWATDLWEKEVLPAILDKWK